MSDENAATAVPTPRKRWPGWKLALYATPVLLLLAAIAVPNFVQARSTACKNACINNLRQIDGAIEQFALEYKKETGALIKPGDAAPYIKGGWPKCPGGGEYSIEQVGQAPKCSLGHTL